MKKKDYILIGVAVLFIVASFFLTGNKKEEPRDYNSILSNVEIKNAVNSISYDYFDALTQTSKENKIIYLGSASCSWCSKFKPILEDITNEYNLAVYYIDLATVSQSEYNKITEFCTRIKLLDLWNNLGYQGCKKWWTGDIASIKIKSYANYNFKAGTKVLIYGR